MLVKRKSSRGLFALKGYVGSLEELSGMLGVNLEEARIFRITVMDMYISGVGDMDVCEDLCARGYNRDVVMREYMRCEGIGDQVSRLVDGGGMSKANGVKEFRNRVMCIGGVTGEVSKDEVVSILSGLLLDSRVDVRQKLVAADLLGKYRDYYKQTQVGKLTIRVERDKPNVGGDGVPVDDINFVVDGGVMKMG